MKFSHNISYMKFVSIPYNDFIYEIFIYEMLCEIFVNLVIISYSIDSQTTFENVRKRWLPEVNQYAPQIPVVLVGLKKDLRDNGSTGTDTDEAGPLRGDIDWGG